MNICLSHYFMQVFSFVARTASRAFYPCGEKHLLLVDHLRKCAFKMQDVTGIAYWRVWDVYVVCRVFRVVDEHPKLKIGAMRVITRSQTWTVAPLCLCL